MLIRSRKSWELTENDVTPEHLYKNRRQIIAAATAGLATAVGLPGCAPAENEDQAAAPAAPSPAIGEDGTLRAAATAYDAAPDGAPPTGYPAIIGYNNFYEFGTQKEDPARYASAMTTDPWSIEIGGLCNKPGTYALEDVVDFNSLEERIYRLRCVEGWSMVIPWVGVPLSSVLAQYEPTSDAKYVAFETYANRDEMRGLRSPVLEWPYVEGLRLDEAMHPLTLLSVGLYGKTLPNQNGAPVRLVVPWKYGFKSTKSIVKISFTAEQPPTSWNLSDPVEYGFYSNVNPNRPHPRWSQEDERIVDVRSLDRRKTDMFNGYADEVAHLYEGMDLIADY